MTSAQSYDEPHTLRSYASHPTYTNSMTACEMDTKDSPTSISSGTNVITNLEQQGSSSILSEIGSFKVMN